MGLAVGIDLGTTYTAVACMDVYHKPVIVQNIDGRSTTPSVVLFEPPHYIVGEVALQSTLTEPEQVAQFVKRSMGCKNQRIHVGGHSYSPEFVSSLILRKVVQDSAIALGDSIDSAVITVPAYFTEAQRQATIEAGEMAGLKVLRIINEPTAAALSYGMTKRGHKRHVLVYDLGGGTFDTTILKIDHDSLDVVAVGGDPHLGGKDFDDRIINYIEEELLARYGLELENDRSFEAELRLKAEAAKRQLSLRQTVPIALKIRQTTKEGDCSSERMVPVRLDLTREKFEEITADLLARTELLLERVMYKADMDWDDISEVLCVGGSSRMPMVQVMLTQLSGKVPLVHDPDECVAKGAAYQAALLMKNVDISLGNVHVGHVLSHSLGVAAIKDGHPFIDHVVPSLTSLPCVQKREGYTTVQDNQTSVQVHIYEGESLDPEAYASGPIGAFQLDASPPRPKGRPRISVEFMCDENGRVIAIARDMDTGKESRSHITLTSMRNTSETNEEAELLAQAIVA